MLATSNVQQNTEEKVRSGDLVSGSFEEETQPPEEEMMSPVLSENEQSADEKDDVAADVADGVAAVSAASDGVSDEMNEIMKKNKALSAQIESLQAQLSENADSINSMQEALAGADVSDETVGDGGTRVVEQVVAVSAEEEVSQSSGSAPDAKAEDAESGNWLLGEVGAVTLDDLATYLIPMIFPHVFASVVPKEEAELLEGQRAELAELEAQTEDLKSRSKMDPFAAFTGDAKGREVKRLKKKISLAIAEGKVNAWRVTRDILREQLVEAETQHLEWRRNYREIERGKRTLK